jgi:hypothetical protein
MEGLIVVVVPEEEKEYLPLYSKNEGAANILKK